MNGIENRRKEEAESPCTLRAVRFEVWGQRAELRGAVGCKEIGGEGKGLLPNTGGDYDEHLWCPQAM